MPQGQSALNLSDNGYASRVLVSHLILHWERNGVNYHLNCHNYWYYRFGMIFYILYLRFYFATIKSK